MRSHPTGTADLALASAVLGSGVQVSLVDRLFLAAPRDEEQAGAAALRALTAAKVRLSKGQKALESPAEIEAYIRERARFFFKDLLPFLRLLRVAD